MKKILFLAALLAIMAINTQKSYAQAKKPQYCYISCTGDGGYALHHLYSDVFRIPDDRKSDDAITNQFTDSVKIKYGEKYYEWDHYFVWRFNNKGDAEKDRTGKIAEDKSTNWSSEYIHDFWYNDSK
jgi:hypothetical protein